MNEVCKEIAELNMTGNIVPIVWFENLQYETGKGTKKAYILAILILSDIVYWYKPYEIRDEQTGRLIEYKQKFSSDKLQKSYKQYADLFGSTKIAVKSAVDFLIDKGLIKREFRDIFVRNKRLNNVMYLEPIYLKVKKITVSPEKNGDSKILTTPPQKKMGTYTKTTHSENTHEIKKIKNKKSGEQKNYYQYVNRLRRFADKFKSNNDPFVLTFEDKFYDFEYREDGNHYLRNAITKKLLSKEDAEYIYKVLNHRGEIPIYRNTSGDLNNSCLKAK